MTPNIPSIIMPNETTLLLLGGLVLLLVNILYGLFRAWRGNLTPGWFSVSLALVASALITVGVVRSATTPAGNFRDNRAGAASTSTNGTPLAASAASDPAATAAPGTNQRRRSQTGTNTNGGNAGSTNAAAPQLAAGAASDPAATAAPGTNQRRRSQNGTNTSGTVIVPVDQPALAASTPNADVSGSSGTGNNATNGTNPFANGGNLPLGVALNRSSMTIAEIGAIVCIVLALGLYFVERRRANFTPNNSRGLLNAGVGFFAIIALLLIPLIPAQINAAAPTTNVRPNSAQAVARVITTATPTFVPTATRTPTLVPSLTPMLTDTPMPTPTQILYPGAQQATIVAATASSLPQCTVTNAANLNLRSGPSTNHPVLLSIPAGSSVPVTGQSSDKKWFQVVYTRDGAATTGWIAAQYTTPNGACDAVAVVQ